MSDGDVKVGATTVEALVTFLDHQIDGLLELQREAEALLPSGLRREEYLAAMTEQLLSLRTARMAVLGKVAPIEAVE